MFSFVIPTVLYLNSILGPAVPELPDWVKDTQFSYVQEACIDSFGKVHAGDEVLSSVEIDFLRKLASSRYTQRIEARKEVIALERGAIRMLYWGTRLRDSETACVSRSLIDQIYICTGCKGTGLGESPHEEEIESLDPEQVDGRYVSADPPRCPECLGSGNYQYYLWDEFVEATGRYQQVKHIRDAFTPEGN